MIPFLKNCWQRLWVRGLVYTFATLVTAAVLLSSGMSWWGAKAWSRAVARLEQEKETLDFRKVAPDPVPDEANFCAIPLLKGLALTEKGGADQGASAERRKKLAAMGIPENSGEGSATPPSAPNSAALGEPVDLKPWADLLRTDPRRAVPDSGDSAKDLLAMFSKDHAALGELAAALEREHAQWTPSWKTRELPDNLFAVQLPHYQAIMGLQQTLCLRAIAAARAGTGATALESLRIAVRLSEASLQEPFLIGMLVGVSQIARVAAAVWELCRAQTGTVADFTGLQQALERCDVRQSALRAYRAELAGAAGAILWLDRSRDPGTFAMIQTGGTEQAPPAAQLLARGLPSGFFTSNAATVVDMELEHVILPLRDQGLAACARHGGDLEKEIGKRRGHWITHPGSILACLMIPAVSQCAHKACYAQGQLDQSIAACALERFRLERGAYPDSLAEVKRTDGGDLPRDVYSGKPMGYRKTDHGRYILWCTGPDGKDDGGKRALDPKNPQGTKFRDPQYQGDWVWDFGAGPK